MFAIDINEWELANILEETRQKRLAEIGAFPQCADSPEPPRDASRIA
jgi:hypothetical protein